MLRDLPSRPPARSGRPAIDSLEPWLRAVHLVDMALDALRQGGTPGNPCRAASTVQGDEVTLRSAAGAVLGVWLLDAAGRMVLIEDVDLER